MLLPPQRGPHGNSIVIIATVGMEASEAGYNRHPWQWLDFHLHHKRSSWCHLPQSCHHAHQHLVPCLQGLPHWTSPPEISCPYSHDLTADDRYGLNFGGTGGIGDVSRDGELSDSVVGLETHGALKQHYLERGVHRRMRRSSMGTGKSHENPGMLFQSIMTSNITGVGSEYTWLLHARRAQPCSYCHVPYHHHLAPFTNMKLVPCLLYPWSHPRNDGTTSQTAHSRHGCLYSG